MNASTADCGRDAKTPGQLAYEEDVRLCPTYHDGAPRRRWNEIPWYAQQSWEEHPVPRAIHIYRGASR